MQAWKDPQKLLINLILLHTASAAGILTYLNLDDKFLLVQHNDTDWTPRWVLRGGGRTGPRWHGHRLRHGAASTSAVSLTPSSLSQCHVLYHHPAPNINTVNRSWWKISGTPYMHSTSSPQGDDVWIKSCRKGEENLLHFARFLLSTEPWESDSATLEG